jgi:prepilin peptidase CpaA
MAVWLLLMTVLPVLLVTAAIFDIASYTIPNLLNAAIIALFVIFVLATALLGHPLSWAALGWHALAGFIGLAVGMVLFALGWIGGGDAKLFAGAALWLGLSTLYEYALIVSLFGGALTISLMVLRGMPLPPFLMTQPWIARLTDRRSGIPYGVALALAVLVVLPDTEVFRLAAAY